MKLQKSIFYLGLLMLLRTSEAAREPRHMLDRPTIRHNTLGTSRYPVCTVGDREAACMSSAACEMQRGRFTGVCFGDPSLVCCVVEKTCDEEASTHSVTFRNPSYPLENLKPSLCPLRIKVGRDVCAMRLDLIVFELERGSRSGCEFDMLMVLGSVEGPTVAICGNRTGFATTFEVREVSEVTLALVTQSPHKFSMTATQLPCTSGPKFISPSSAGLRVHTATAPPDMATRGDQQGQNGDSKLLYETEDVTPMSQFFKEFYERERVAVPTRCAGEENNPQVPRVIDGYFTNAHEYPWQAALFHNSRKKNVTKLKFFCGASVISDSFLLTAAHCVLGSKNVGDIQVIFGGHNLSTKNEAGRQVRAIRRIIFNVHFNSNSLKNDIALIQLTEPLAFSSAVNAVLLPFEPEDTFAGLNGTVTGWGRISSHTKDPSPVLKEYTAPLFSGEQCARMWASRSKRATAEAQTHVCIDVSKGSPCHGDSGGPLVVCNGEVCTQIGVVSFGFPLCTNVGLPAVFTRLTHYRPWLDINLASAIAKPAY